MVLENTRSSRPNRRGRPKTDELREQSSKRFTVSREEEVRSPVSTGEKSDTLPARGRGGTVSNREGGYFVEKSDTVPSLVAEGIRGDSGDVLSQPLEGGDATDEVSDYEAEVTKANEAAEAIEEQMKGYPEESYPRKHHSPAEDSGHESLLRHPCSGNALSDADRVAMKDPGPLSPSNKQVSDHVLLPKVPGSNHSIDKTSGHENQAESDMGQKANETETPSKTSVSSYNNERDSLDLQSQPPESESTLVAASPIHHPVERQSDPEVNKTKEAPNSPSPGNMENKSHNSRPKSHRSDHIKSPDPQPKSPGAMENKSHDSRHKSPGRDHSKSPDPRFNSPGSDQSKSPDLQPQSPGPGGATLETSPAQDRVREDLDTEAWLNSDSPLAGNYRAILEDPSSPLSISPDRSSNAGSRTDSLIVSPTRSDERQNFEESPSDSRANAEIMKIFAEYKADSQLKPPSREQEAEDERGARAATDRQSGSVRGRTSGRSSTSSTNIEDSLLLPPDQDGDASRTNSEDVRDDIEKAREEEVHQAALNLFGLYSANFQLQKILDEKEAKFKREIETAWKAPRPPPTTQQQRYDKIALEKMESKEIFDEVGDQQRPIWTDPQMVLLETEVDIMITRAQINYILGDFPQMYTRANHAAECARQLRYPPLTARCCYYRGVASYHYRDFSNAKEDFLMSRGCAGRYGISSESIEKYIDDIDKADDPETAIIERFQARRSSRVRKSEWTTTDRSTDVDDEDEPSPSTADDATTLVDGSPPSPDDNDLPRSPFSSLNNEERSAGQSREDANSQFRSLRRPSHPGGITLDDDPQPSFDEVPNYQPQDEAVSEEIRKDIFESKTQSLDPVNKESPTEANHQDKETFSPPSMASTECTLLGSTTSQGTARRVPRPYIAPITTSFATVTHVREAPPEATPDSGYTDEVDEDEVMRYLNTAREDASPVTA